MFVFTFTIMHSTHVKFWTVLFKQKNLLLTKLKYMPKCNDILIKAKQKILWKAIFGGRNHHMGGEDTLVTWVASRDVTWVMMCRHVISMMI